VNARLVLATDKGAVMIPNEATQISQKGPFVYVVKSDQTAELRVITLGQRQGGNVVVTNGLVAGENVVLTGQLTVVPGAKVKVVQGAPEGTNPTGNSDGDESKGVGGRS
jgi:multidrug efflux system membrane fusion protein